MAVASLVCPGSSAGALLAAETGNSKLRNLAGGLLTLYSTPPAPCTPKEAFGVQGVGPPTREVGKDFLVCPVWVLGHLDWPFIIIFFFFFF